MLNKTHGHFDDQNEPTFPRGTPNTESPLHFPQVPLPSLQYLQELQFVQALHDAFPTHRPAKQSELISKKSPISKE